MGFAKVLCALPVFMVQERIDEVMTVVSIFPWSYSHSIHLSKEEIMEIMRLKNSRSTNSI